jgi:hypothetical protein
LSEPDEDTVGEADASTGGVTEIAWSPYAPRMREVSARIFGSVVGG